MLALLFNQLFSGISYIFPFNHYANRCIFKNLTIHFVVLESGTYIIADIAFSLAVLTSLIYESIDNLGHVGW